MSTLIGKRPGVPIGMGLLVVLAALPLALAGPAGLRIGSLFFVAVIALSGLHVVVGLGRLISLAHASFVGVGAYGCAIATVQWGLSPLSGLIVGTSVAVLLSAGVAALTNRLEDHYLALATLACGEILSNIFRGATAWTGGANGLSGIPSIEIAGLSLASPARYYPLCAVLGALSLLVVAALDRSRLGQSLRALGDERSLVGALGLSQSRLRLAGFAVAGAFAGIAGAISAQLDGFVGPETYGLGLSIAYVCFLVIGGLGQLRGVVVGAALASLGPELLRGLVEWQMVVVGLAALAVLVMRRSSRGALR